MQKPSLKQLEYAIAVARCGSFRGAAEELEVSQPTLTAQIARAEKILGVQLFERTRSGAQLTPAGRLFEPCARRVIESMNELSQVLGEANVDRRAMYRLGVKATLGPYLLPQILPSLRELYGDLKLFVREDTPRGLEDGLARGDYDLIITSLPINTPNLEQAQLLRESILLAVPIDHPLAKKPSWKGSDLAGEKVLTTEPGHLFAITVEAVCSRLGAEVQRDYEGSSLDALRLMVVMGMGLAFLPALYADSEIRNDSGLVVRQLEDEDIARLHVLAWRPGSSSRNFYRRLAGDLRRIIAERLGNAVQVVDP
ncbi:MAG: hydrogen peroxide-inducible genes activator [Congregibacter sp.]